MCVCAHTHRKMRHYTHGARTSATLGVSEHCASYTLELRHASIVALVHCVAGPTQVPFRQSSDGTRMTPVIAEYMPDGVFWHCSQRKKKV